MTVSLKTVCMAQSQPARSGWPKDYLVKNMRYFCDLCHGPVFVFFEDENDAWTKTFSRAQATLLKRSIW